MGRKLTRKQQKAMFAKMNDKTFNYVDDFKPVISKKTWNHIEDAEKYAEELRKRGYEARAFNVYRKHNKVEFRKR